MQVTEFLLTARLDAASLEVWIAEGWLVPRRETGTADFSEADLARAALIHDLRRMGINDEGVSVVLDLVDQIHGLRRALREILLVSAEKPGGAPAAASAAERGALPDGSSDRGGS